VSFVEATQVYYTVLRWRSSQRKLALKHCRGLVWASKGSKSLT